MQQGRQFTDDTEVQQRFSKLELELEEIGEILRIALPDTIAPKLLAKYHSMSCKVTEAMEEMRVISLEQRHELLAVKKQLQKTQEELRLWKK